MQMITFGWQFLRRLMKQVGPYMLIELLLPGGTLFALILHISRCGAWSALQPMPVVCQPYAQCQVLVERNAGVRSACVRAIRRGVTCQEPKLLGPPPPCPATRLGR